MKQPLAILLLLFSFVSAQETVAVIEFEAINIGAPEVQILTDRFRVELANTDSFKLVERPAMEEILNEQGFQQSGCTSNECAVEVGKLLGVERMIAGTVGKIGELFTITARVVNVQTGEIINQHSIDCRCSIETLLTSEMKKMAIVFSGVKTIRSSPVTTTTADPPKPRKARGLVKFNAGQGEIDIYEHRYGQIPSQIFKGKIPNNEESVTIDYLPGEYEFVAFKNDYRRFYGQFEVLIDAVTEVSFELQEKNYDDPPSIVGGIKSITEKMQYTNSHLPLIGISGNMIVDVLVDSIGNVKETKLIKEFSSRALRNREFETTILMHLQDVKFIPATKGGIPVEAWYGFIIPFSIPNFTLESEPMSQSKPRTFQDQQQGYDSKSDLQIIFWGLILYYFLASYLNIVGV